MFTVHQLAKSFALKSLFTNVTFSLSLGDRIGLVGPNGCGKTTLLKLINGSEIADSGHVTYDSELRIGYLPQGFNHGPGETIGTVVGRAAGNIATLETELGELAEELSRKPDSTNLHNRYDAVLQRITTAETGRAAKILAKLGLADLPQDYPIDQLSGGQQTRLNLALALQGDPQLLLLDEPTNHLDIEMLEWLESWLGKFSGGALIVSHDRTFLDHTVNRILAMDPNQQKIQEYSGNYTDYSEALDREREKQWASYNDQQHEIRRVKQDILRTKAQAAHTERQASSVRIGGEMMKLKGYKDYQRSIAKKVAKKSKVRESKLERYLESEERVERPTRQRNIHLKFDETAHLGHSVMSLIDLTVGYDQDIPLLSHLHLSLSPAARIVLSGPNGSGKTTLLRTLSGQIPPLSGTVDLGPSVKLGYMTQEQSGLDPSLSPLETIQDAFSTVTKARNYLANYLFFGDEPLKPIGKLSYGQRARLELIKLVVAGCNVLFLDEPINHLDIPSRTQFEEALSNFEGTILVVMHDRYFIDRFASEVWWLEGGGIKRKLC